MGRIVYVIADAPWGPVKVEGADSLDDMRARITALPAHVEDIGDCDPTAIVEAVRLALAPRSSSPWWPVSVAKAAAKVQEARSRLAAVLGAAEPVPVAVEAPGKSEGALPRVGSTKFIDRFAPTRPFTNVRAIRDKLGLSQSGFARAFGISLQTVQDWEQGRSKPDQTARSYLSVIKSRSDMVREALGR